MCESWKEGKKENCLNKNKYKILCVKLIFQHFVQYSKVLCVVKDVSEFCI